MHASCKVWSDRWLGAIKAAVLKDKGHDPRQDPEGVARRCEVREVVGGEQEQLLDAFVDRGRPAGPYATDVNDEQIQKQSAKQRSIFQIDGFFYETFAFKLGSGSFY